MSVAVCLSLAQTTTDLATAHSKVLDVLFELSIIAMQLHADASTTPSHRKTCVPADTKSGKV